MVKLIVYAFMDKDNMRGLCACGWCH